MEELRNSEESQYLTSFYRIIMPSVVRERRLVLPKRFVEEYGEELSRTIRLELPVGDLWHVKVVKSGTLVCLQDGLDKFMKNYSVGFGYFLLFKYKGNRLFHLHIFDLTATEIDYRLGFLKPKSSWKGFPTDVKIMEEKKDESPPRKKQKTTPTCTDLILYQTRASKTQLGSAPSNKEEKKSSNKKLKHSSKGKLEKETDGKKVVETESALDKAEMYRTDNPSCVVQLQEYNISRHNLKLPTQFCREHERDYAEDIEIHDSDDTIYHAKCWRPDDRWCLGKGWSQFVKAKGLQVGDVCVFEIVKKGIIKISIFQAKCDGKNSMNV